MDTLGTFGPNKLENCKKLQDTERLGFLGKRLDRGPCASTDDTLPLLSLFRTPSADRQALQLARCVVHFVDGIYDYQ